MLLFFDPSLFLYLLLLPFPGPVQLRQLSLYVHLNVPQLFVAYLGEIGDFQLLLVFGEGLLVYDLPNAH